MANENAHVKLRTLCVLYGYAARVTDDKRNALCRLFLSSTALLQCSPFMKQITQTQKASARTTTSELTYVRISAPFYGEAATQAQGIFSRDGALNHVVPTEDFDLLASHISSLLIVICISERIDFLQLQNIDSKYCIPLATARSVFSMSTPASNAFSRRLTRVVYARRRLCGLNPRRRKTPFGPRNVPLHLMRTVSSNKGFLVGLM